MAGLFAALFYTLVSGYEVPAQRTLYMLATVCVMLMLSRNVSPSQLLATALMVVLLADPWAVLSPGFWLSFGAVALIFYVTANRLHKQHWLREYGKVQWAMMIGLIPPLLAMFQQLSLVSPIANAFAIPLVSFVVVPLTLLGTLPPFEWMLYVAHEAMVLCMFLLNLLDRLPYGVWAQHAPPAWTIVFGMGGALWMLAPRGFPMRWLGVFLLLPMFLVAPDRPAEGSARVVVFDVGQGLSVAVQTRNHALLYDTGPDFSGEADSGSRILHSRAARHGYRATRCARAVAWRHGSHRRNGIGIARTSGDERHLLVAEHASETATRRPQRTLRRRPVLGMGRSALRHAASRQIKHPGRPGA